jgi:hypothetical protein
MAYDTTQLRCKYAGMSRQYYNEWLYDTLDAISTVRAANYFSDAQAKGMQPGDIVFVRVWTTTIITGTFAGFSILPVLTVASTGADTTDGTAITMTNS